MLCNKCRIELPHASIFCPRCGLRVSSRPAGPADLTRPWPVTVLAIVHFGAALLLGFGTIAGVTVVAGGESSDLPLVLFFATMTALQVAAGIGLWKLRSWGRVLQIVLSCFGLLAIPLGTIFSVLVLFYMFQPRARILFAGRSPRELSAQELEILAAPTPAGVVVVIAAIGVIGFMATGIVAAIAVPNFLYALDSARAKRTVIDMRAVAELTERYAAEHGRYPQAGSADALESLLVPRYAARLSLVDGWNRPLVVRSEPRQYWIGSAGKDGKLEEDLVGGATKHFEADVVLTNGEFVQWPERGQSVVDEWATARASRVVPATPAMSAAEAVEVERRKLAEAMAGAPRRERTPLPRIDRSRLVTTPATEVPLDQARDYIGRIVDVVDHDGFRIQAKLLGTTEDGIMLDHGPGRAIIDHEVKHSDIRTLAVHP